MIEEFCVVLCREARIQITTCHTYMAPCPEGQIADKNSLPSCTRQVPSTFRDECAPSPTNPTIKQVQLAMRSVCKYIFILFFFSIPAKAEDDSASLVADQPRRANWLALLDPSVDKAIRMTELDLARTEAMAGDSYMQYLLGALYRLGMDHPAKLVARDDDRAARFLSNAAINGRPFAMAGMAELRLKQGKQADAYVWASLYAHYTIVVFDLWKQVQDRESRGDESAIAPYAASLLSRCQNGIGSDSQSVLHAHVVAFVAKYDEHIRSVLQSSVDVAKARPSRFRRWGRGNVFTPERYKSRRSGLAVFMNAVNSDGKVEQVLVADSLPTGRFANAFRQVSQTSLYHASAPADGLKWIMQPLEFNKDGVGLSPIASD